MQRQGLVHSRHVVSEDRFPERGHDGLHEGFVATNEIVDVLPRGCLAVCVQEQSEIRLRQRVQVWREEPVPVQIVELGAEAVSPFLLVP